MKRTVAIVVFPGVQSLDVSGPMDVFSEANRFLLPQERYQLEVIGSESGALACSNGLCLNPHLHFSIATAAYDLLLVAGGPSLGEQDLGDAFHTWLRTASVRARRFGSICNGAFALARAGLLDGRTVTTHWNDAPALAARYPRISVQVDRLFVQDGSLFTSAGVSAGIDLSLHLLAQDHGAEVALNVAKRLVVFIQRAGGQSQFSPYLTPHFEPASPLAQVQKHVMDHLAENLSLSALARIASMSSRNFSRVFARDAGITPGAYVESARVDRARVLLESSTMPLKTIAHRCGFGNAHTMRDVFKRRFGVSPQQYRLNFSKT